MTSTNKTQAFKALNDFADSRTQLITALHEAGYSVETARDVVIEWACEKMKAGKKGYNIKANGAVTLNSSHAQYETLKTIVRDIMHMINGTTRRKATHAKTEKVAVSKAKVSAVVALAEGLTKAEFDALLAAVRESVSFV